MKKYLKKLGLLLMVLACTGCMKVDLSMEIHKDKSMDLQIVEAFESSFLNNLGDASSIESNEEELKKKGYTIEDYTEGSKTGYKITKHFKSIDEVSTTEEITTDVEDMTDDEQFFTVKKGFFKNIYRAKFNGVSQDELDLGDSQDSENSDEYSNIEGSNEEDYSDLFDSPETYFDDTNTVTDNSTDFSGLEGLDPSMLNNMEMTFQVQLPNKAISHNATNVSEDGKKLSWNLLQLNGSEVQFEFAMYNMVNVWVTIGIGIFLLLVIISIIIKIMKKPKSIVLQPVGAEEPLHPIHENQASNFMDFPTGTIPQNPAMSFQNEPSTSGSQLNDASYQAPYPNQYNDASPSMNENNNNPTNNTPGNNNPLF